MDESAAPPKLQEVAFPGSHHSHQKFISVIISSAAAQTGNVSRFTVLLTSGLLEGSVVENHPLVMSQRRIRSAVDIAHVVVPNKRPSVSSGEHGPRVSFYCARFFFRAGRADKAGGFSLAPRSAPMLPS